MDSFFKTGGRNDSIPGMIGSSMLKSEEFKIDMFNSLLFYFGHSGDLDELNKFKEKLTDVFLDQKRIN